MANLSNINNKLIVSDGGHLLINQTANANYVLQMDGLDGTVYSYFKSNVATTGARIGLNSDDFRVFNQQASGELHLGTAGTTRLTISSGGDATFAGNVGIGAAPVGNPGTNILAVGTAGTTAGGIQLWAANNQAHYLQFGDANSGGEVYRGGIGYNHSSETLLFLQNSSTALSITGSQAATFAGDVNITGGTTNGLNITTSGTQDTINIDRAANTDNAITKYQTASADKWIVGLRNTSDDKFRFYSYGTATDVLTINQADGNVGIGTDSPAVNLQVESSAGPGIAFSNSGTPSSGSSRGDLAWFNSAISTTALIRSGAVTDNVGSDLQFFTRPAAGALTERMRIAASGYVGIGDTSPQGKLEVNNRNTATGAALFIKGGEDDLDPIAGQYTGLAFGYGGGDIYNNAAILWEFTNTAANGKLHFAVNPTGADGTANLSDSKMTILDSGNVGIGTTSPGAKLEVRSDAANPDYGVYFHNSGGGRVLKIYNTDWDAGDNLIYASNGGTATPSLGYEFVVTGNAKVHLTASDAYFEAAGAGGTPGTDSMLFGQNSTKVGYVWNRSTISTAHILFGTSGTERMRIHEGGAFQIGSGHFIDLATNGQHYHAAGPSGLTMREYEYYVDIPNGSTIDLFKNTAAYSDIQMVQISIVMYHSSRTYFTGMGTIGGYGLALTGAGIGTANGGLTSAADGTGVRKLQISQSSGYTATARIYIQIRTESAITVINGTLSSTV